MKVIKKIKKYLRFNLEKTDWESVKTHLALIVILTVAAVGFNGLWHSDFFYVNWKMLKKIIPDFIYYPTEYYMVFKKSFGFIGHFIVLCYIFLFLAVVYMSSLKLRTVFRIGLYFLILFHLTFYFSARYPIQKEIKETSDCGSMLMLEYEAARFWKKVDPSVYPPYIWKEDPPGSHPGDLRHRVMSDGTLLKVLPWREKKVK